MAARNSPSYTPVAKAKSRGAVTNVGTIPRGMRGTALIKYTSALE